MDISNSEKKESIVFPAIITFKSIFANRPDVRERIDAILDEVGIEGEIHSKQSSKNNYISYTVTAEFESNELLQETCTRISSLRGFMMMF